MLIIARAEEEEVVVDGGVMKIKVLSIKGGIVRLGFQADEAITIHRREVQDAIDARRAAGLPEPPRRPRRDGRERRG